MAVCIRMKKIGRHGRPFFRICATDKRAPRDGRVLEELGTYDTSIADTDARAIMKNERVDYWLSVGAQPSERVAVLIKKYGTNGTHKDAQKAALEKLAQPRSIPEPGAPASLPQKKEDAKKEDAKKEEAKPAEAAVEAPAAEAPPAETPTLGESAAASE